MRSGLVAPHVLSEIKAVGELNTDPISIGNWSRHPQGMVWFIEVGERITEVTKQGPEETPMALDNFMNNQEELEDQPVGEHEEYQAGPAPTVTLVMASGSISKPSTCLIKEIGKAALTAARTIIILHLVN